MPTRPYLVFVRAGHSSLHPELLAADPRRNWDCCVSWYSPPRRESLAEHYTSGGDNKYDAFVAAHAGLLAGRGYRRVLLLDDDVRFRPGDVSRLFRICEREALSLAQPALAWGTHANHALTLWNPACRVRRVRFVEVMAPCFSAETLDRLLPTFTLTRSTWGIDYAWASLLAEQGGLAVVDAVRVRHVKPVDREGGAFYRRLASLGVDPARELAAVRERYRSFGSLSTLDSGHRYRHALPVAINRRAMWLLERLKPALHRALAPPAAPRPSA